MNVNELVGKTLIKVEVKKEDDHEIIFTTNDGTRYRMYHYSDCCESVEIEDINGEIDDLIGSEILGAEEATNDTENPHGINKEDQDSFTWTFYKFRTIKGYVDIRWYGESNGYYSESVDFELME